MDKKILAFGEIIWDIYPDKKAIGGTALNFIAHTALKGAPSSLFCAVGNDDLGNEAVALTTDFGVDCRFVKRVDKPTGQCIVTLDENGLPSYNVIADTAYDNITVTDDEITEIKGEKYKALYFGTLIQRGSTSREALKKLLESVSFPEIICDVNLRTNCFDADSVLRCLENATVLKVSMEEEPLLREFGYYSPKSDKVSDIARALSESFGNLKVVIITLGKEGSFAYDARKNREYTQASIGDKVVSTVGAGDSFAAAWMVSYLLGEPIEICMKKAAELSGFVVANIDAVPRY